MAGHSKWANIQHRKKAQDNKRGKVFTKIIREITVAVKLAGPDISSNSRLRLAMSKANKNSVPKDTIERAIKKGSGQNSDSFEEITYEGYGPKGIAVIIECLTDNKNRTVSEVRHALTKYNGSLGTKGSVAHLFKKIGILTLLDTVEDDLINYIDEIEILDYEQVDNNCIVNTDPSSLFKVKSFFEDKSLKTQDEEIILEPITMCDIDETDIEQVELFTENLEELDDVQNIYTNINIL
jgi:YebC/PmpR family DNA-binding regulatory protein